MSTFGLLCHIFCFRNHKSSYSETRPAWPNVTLSVVSPNVLHKHDQIDATFNLCVLFISINCVILLTCPSAQHEGMQWSGATGYFVLILGTSYRWMFSVKPSPPHLQGRNPRAKWTGDWVGSRAGRGASQMRKISCTCSSLTSGQYVLIKLLFPDLTPRGNTSGQNLI